MRLGPQPAPALAALAAAALGAGCGLGPGEASEGEATLTVTRDYGADQVLEATTQDPPESETVLRMLDREADIETRYGGGFVDSIEGIDGSVFERGRSFDWFFYVNGIESPIGSADRPVRGGDRIWWDHRDWTDAMRVPAVVGSWPEPFLQASAGSDRAPVTVECAGPEPPCDAAQDALADAGVSAAKIAFGKSESPEALRLIVGEWNDIRKDEAASLIGRGPEVSGVFARFDGDGWQLLDAKGEPSLPGESIVAATRSGEDPPTWVVTGTSPESVLDAVGLLSEDELRDRYGVAISAGRPVSLPVEEG